MAERIGRSLERAGLITRHIEHAYLAFEAPQEPQLLLHVESCLKILHRLCTVVLPSWPFKTGEVIMIGFTPEGTKDMNIRNLPIVLFVIVMIAPKPGLAQSAQTTILKTLKDDAPLVIDEFSRQPGRLTVSTESVGRARFQIEAEITENETIAEARIRVWPEGQSEPEMDGTAKVIGEYIFWGHTGEDPATMKVPLGTLIYVPPSATAMEQAVRHAIAVRGDREAVALTVWTPYNSAELSDAEARFPEPGTAELSIFDATYTLSIDSEGNILDGYLEPQGNTIVRE